MTPSNYQIPVWQATSIPSCRPLISSHCMRPHSQKLYKTEADSQLDYQHSRLHKSWCIFKCIFPFEINHIVNAPTDRELKNSFSQYSTSTLQECIRQTYCMYIYIYIDAVEKPDLDRHQHCFSLTRLFCTYASQNEQITLNYTFQNFSMKVARFPAGDASPSTFMCGSPKQILHSWRNGSQAPSLRPHVLNIEITLPKTNKQFRPENKPSQKDVSFREAENDSLVQGSAIFFTRPARVPCSTGNLRNERFGCDRCTMNETTNGGTKKGQTLSQELWAQWILL